MSGCAYAYHVGMENVGHCPDGKCAYGEIFVLTSGQYNTFVNIFVSEQKAFDYAVAYGYDDYSVNPTRLNQ